MSTNRARLGSYSRVLRLGMIEKFQVNHAMKEDCESQIEILLQIESKLLVKTFGRFY